MPEKLTAKHVINAAPRGSRYEIADSLQPGLRLVVQPSGAKSWAYRYEREDRKGVKVTLGRAAGAGALTLQQARDAANDARRLRSTGGDPAAQRRSKRQAEAARIEAEEREARRRDDTVENVLGRYFVDHADHLKSGREIRRVLNRELEGWARRRIDDVGRGDAIRLLDAVKARAPVQSKRLRAYGRHFFGWCMRRELCVANPFEGTEAIKEVSRDRVLTDDELRLLLLAIDRLEWPRRQFFALLLLTAQRLNEVASMEWQELDLPSGTWTLPAARSKNGRTHTIPLAPAAIDLLAGMDRLEGSSQVFSSFSASRAKERLDVVLSDLVEEGGVAAPGDDPIEIKPWRLHDLRRTAATTMPRLGVDVVTVERVLGHTMRGVMAVYQRYSFELEKRRALELWAIFLKSLTTARESNVVRLKIGE